MLDDNFNLKLIDFGLSTTQGNQGSYKYCGSDGYQPPEVLQRKKYQPFEMDMFAAGVILFNMSVGYGPFSSANLQKDVYYKMLTRKDPTYWDCFIKGVPEAVAVFTPEFKDLCTKMFAFKP